PFLHDDNLVRRPPGERFLAAVRPGYLDGIDTVDGTEAKVSARIIAAQVAVARIEPMPPRAAAGPHGELSSVGVAPSQSRIDRPDHEPMATLGNDVAVQQGRPRRRGDQEVERAVAVDVATGQSPCDPRRPAERTVLRRDVPKLSFTIIDKELVPIGVAAQEGTQGGDGLGIDSGLL